MSAPLTALLPIVLLLVIVASDVWVYTDAKERRARGFPVVVTIGSFPIDTPEAWFVACLVVWVVFFPLYLSARR